MLSNRMKWRLGFGTTMLYNSTYNSYKRDYFLGILNNSSVTLGILSSLMRIIAIDMRSSLTGKSDEPRKYSIV